MLTCEKCDIELTAEGICNETVTCPVCGTIYTLDWELMDAYEASWAVWITGEVPQKQEV